MQIHFKTLNGYPHPYFFKSDGQKFSLPADDRLFDLITRYPMQRLSIEVEDQKYRVEETSATETSFDSGRGKTWLSSAYQKSTRLVGQRVTRTETVFPTSRSIRWHDVNRVYLPVWT